MASSSETLSPALPADIERAALAVLKSAVSKDVKLATAESCTGGLLASLLTDVEGCSHCFDRGFVTYSNESKVEILGVGRHELERDGAVSRSTAQQMANGALSRSAADVVVAITGYAGAGEPGAEAGLVYIAAGRRNQEILVSEYHFGDLGRGEIRTRCLRQALHALAEML